MYPSDDPHPLTPEIVLRAYAAGIFPMSESRQSGGIFWVDPRMRGVLPLDRFHVPRRLRRAVRRETFEIRCNTAFAQVIEACGEPTDARPETWINDEIARAFTGLHEMGFAHSVECWRDGTLAGGLYGVALGGAFFGESMFSRADNASKVALVHLVARLRLGGYTLLDTQFVTDHLRHFGAKEIPARDYLRRLDAALRVDARFYGDPAPGDLASALEALFAQSSTQTS